MDQNLFCILFKVARTARWFSKPILTRQNITSTKNSQEFLASQVLCRGEIKPPTPVLLTVHFSATLKALVLGNLFKLFRLDITLAREVCCLGIKMKKILKIVLFFSLCPVANCPCECDDKSFKLE